MRRNISGVGLAQAWFLLGALFCLVSLFFVPEGGRENSAVGVVIFSIALWASYHQPDRPLEPEEDEPPDNRHPIDNRRRRR